MPRVEKGCHIINFVKLRQFRRCAPAPAQEGRGLLGQMNLRIENPLF
ncbi:hypothetical protein LEP1GSC058_2967 [Leptospira fainei serovar Hurstbridge str. BUT 6]|uniref:Uncharacterized protein n=1 Tax=Leptospira fainei serovar Hurstbridge str. BUT 6 TaxID=1193011 RepID=S3UTL3_9LEPT|nr:hypothetical protein LEP1GSC058_2967 [Leptospira fainei serovar Hurstbridge str. BUT 6]